MNDKVVAHCRHHGDYTLAHIACPKCLIELREKVKQWEKDNQNMEAVIFKLEAENVNLRHERATLRQQLKDQDLAGLYQALQLIGQLHSRVDCTIGTPDCSYCNQIQGLVDLFKDDPPVNLPGKEDGE